MTTLDTWDYKLIRLLKGENSRPKALHLRALWAERCLLNLGDVRLPHVVDRLAEIVDAFNPMPLCDLIEAANPLNAWKYGNEVPIDYHAAWLSVLASRIRLTDVVKLPGYREWLTQQEIEEACAKERDAAILAEREENGL